MKQEKAYKSMIGEKKMKDILKGVTVKILSVIVMIALIVGGGCFAYKYYIGKITNETGHEVVNSIEVVKEKINDVAIKHGWFVEDKFVKNELETKQEHIYFSASYLEHRIQNEHTVELLLIH